MQADLQPFGGSGSTCSTANLVRLLRKAEEGSGLEIDYSDALSEALGQGKDHGKDSLRAMSQQQKVARNSSSLLCRVPSLGRKRYVHAVCSRLRYLRKILEAHEVLHVSNKSTTRAWRPRNCVY